MRILRRTTFSNVIALLALFIALGGTVYAAGKINGKSIKSGSIPGNRIKKNSLTGNQINEGSLKSVVNYVSVNGTLSASATAPITITATCPAGQKAVGGGGTVNSTAHSGYVNDMNVSGGGTSFTAVFVSGGTDESATVTAACVPAA